MAAKTPREIWDNENKCIARDGGRAALKASLTAPQLIRRMAETIVDLAAANDNCTLDDLRNAGFSAAELGRFLPRAKLIAGRMAPQLRGAA